MRTNLFLKFREELGVLSDAALVTSFGLIAAISWGISDFFAAKASKSIGPVASAFLVNIIGAFAFVVIYLLILRPETTFSTNNLLLAAVSGVIITVGAVAFFKGLAVGPVSLVSPISSAYPLVTTVLALAVFNVKLTAWQLVGITFVMTGIMLATELVSAKLHLNKRIGSGPAWALLTALSWGIGFSLLARAISAMGWESATLLELIFVSLTFCLLLPFIKGGENISLKALRVAARNKFILGAGLIQLGGVLGLNLGLGQENASGAIVTAISASYPVLTVFLALRHFEENVKLLPLIGAFVSVVGIVFITVG